MASGMSSPWVHRYHPSDEAKFRLMCFPHAGGSASYFYPFSKGLTSDVEVLALQYPGRQERRTEPLVDDLLELADRIAGEVPRWLDRPTAFFGHSMGASLAFEVARRLERKGIHIERLFLSGRQAPRRTTHGGSYLLSDDELVEEVRKLSGTDNAVLDDPEIVRMVLPAIRSDYRAAETYRYLDGSDVSCPIIALIGDEDPRVTVDGVRAWRDFTSSEFRSEVFSGGHFFLNDHESDILTTIIDHFRVRSR